MADETRRGADFKVLTETVEGVVEENGQSVRIRVKVQVVAQERMADSSFPYAVMSEVLGPVHDYLKTSQRAEEEKRFEGIDALLRDLFGPEINNAA